MRSGFAHAIRWISFKARSDVMCSERDQRDYCLMMFVTTIEPTPDACLVHSYISTKFSSSVTATTHRGPGLRNRLSVSQT